MNLKIVRQRFCKTVKAHMTVVDIIWLILFSGAIFTGFCFKLLWQKPEALHSLFLRDMFTLGDFLQMFLTWFLTLLTYGIVRISLEAKER
ncbi:MAG: hypothetical protein OET90_08205 [Desulfuromonadales bacterium]|nr:hypothetical protein [Desulfuromonadales bacterium]